MQRRSPRALVLAVALFLALAGAALGSAGVLKLASRVDTSGHAVVVNPAGRTLYSLSGETTAHLLCKQGCLSVWPPLTVPSRSTRLVLASPVKGRLGLLRRRNGSLQVTFRGMPVYRYSGDSAKGEANGEGIEADGGIWHAVGPTPTSAAPVGSKNSTPPYTY